MCMRRVLGRPTLEDQSVFESQPKQSGSDAKSGVDGGGSDSEYITDDDEPDYKKVSKE